MILYEFKKLKTQKIAWLFIFICLACTVFLMTRTDSFKEPRWVEHYPDLVEEYESIFEDMTYEEVSAYIEEERGVLETELRNQRRNRNDAATWDTTLSDRNSVLRRLQEKYAYLATYDEYLELVLEQAEQMKNNKIFANDSFSMSNILLTEEAYGKLKGIELSDDAPVFVSVVAEFTLADYILIVQIMIVTIMVFGSEEGLKGLLRSKYRGRLHVFVSKLATEFICVAVLTLLTYGFMFLTGYLRLGGGDFDALLQSFDTFKRCAVELPAGDFMVLFVLLKIPAACLIAVVSVVFVMLAGASVGSLLNVAFLAVSWVMYTYIDGTLLLSPLKYCNVVAWIDTFGWISGYRNVNLLGKAVPFGTCFAVGVSVSMVVLIVVACRIYLSDVQLKIGKSAKKLEKIIEMFRGKTVQSASLKFHEAYRLAVSEWQWLLILLLVGFAVLFAGERFGGKLYEGSLAYVFYLDKVPGEFSDEMWEYLEKEKAYLEERDGYRDSLNSDYANGVLTKDEYDKAIKDLNMDISLLDGFEDVYDTAKTVRTVHKKGITNLGIVNKHLSEALFLRDGNQILLELLLAGLIFVILGRYFLSDYNIVGLVKSTWNGRGEAQWVRAIYAVLFSCCAGILIYLAYYMQIWNVFDTDRMSFAIQSLATYAELEQGITLKEIYTASIVAKFVGIICLTLFTYFLSLWRFKRSLYNIISIVVVVAPPILSYLGAPSDFILFDGFFRVEELITGGIGPVITYMSGMIAALCMFGILSVRKHRRGEG